MFLRRPTHSHLNTSWHDLAFVDRVHGGLQLDVARVGPAGSDRVTMPGDTLGLPGW